MCATTECANQWTDTHKSGVGAFQALPNEVIAIVLANLEVEDMSSLSITNKWFRDFIRDNFVESKAGLQWLFRTLSVGTTQLMTDLCTASAQHKQRLHSYQRLGVV
jgi:hypothetical protein